VSPDELLTWVRGTPFVPFRIRLKDGRVYDIRHPQSLKVGRTSLVILTYTGGQFDTFDRWEKTSPDWIVHVERCLSAE
jgi:hypothetical protein